MGCVQSVLIISFGAIRWPITKQKSVMRTSLIPPRGISDWKQVSY